MICSREPVVQIVFVDNVKREVHLVKLEIGRCESQSVKVVKETVEFRNVGCRSCSQNNMELLSKIFGFSTFILELNFRIETRSYSHSLSNGCKCTIVIISWRR